MERRIIFANRSEGNFKRKRAEGRKNARNNRTEQRVKTEWERKEL